MKLWLLTALLLFPLVAGATGFAKQSLFLSKTPVTEGDTVLIHAIVANDSTAKFTGDVVFKDGEVKIGTVAVSIAAQGANAVSVSWKPSAGSHNVVAELTTGGGAVVEKQSATFLINEKPKPATVGSSTISTSSPVEPSTDLQNKLNDLSPAVGGYATPVFAAIDMARAKVASFLDDGINWAKEKSSGKSGSVAGAQTSMTDTATSWFATAALQVLSAIRFVVGNAGLFYPVFAILFFYILRRIFKRMRRPSYGAI